jgi:hypothetical protein
MQAAAPPPSSHIQAGAHRLYVCQCLCRTRTQATRCSRQHLHRSAFPGNDPPNGLLGAPLRRFSPHGLQSLPEHPPALLLLQKPGRCYWGSFHSAVTQRLRHSQSSCGLACSQAGHVAQNLRASSYRAVSNLKSNSIWIWMQFIRHCAVVCLRCSCSAADASASAA